MIKYGYHESSERDAELIMTCVRLINKLQNEEYYDNKKGISECHAQHNKAKRLLFKILNDRIEGWWN